MSLILSHFPQGLSPRDGQADVLRKLAAGWKSHDVVCLVAPTAFGKQHVAATIARWAGSAQIIMPNNLQLDQYVEARYGFAVGKSRESYWCSTNKRSCEAQHAKAGCCCKDVCPYTKAVESYTRSSLGVANYYTYLSHRPYRDCLIVDEAHNALELLKDLARKRIWQREYLYPADARTLGDLIQWIEKLESKGKVLDSKLAKLKKELLALEPSTLVRRSQQLWRGQPQDVLELLPLDVRNEQPILWPAHRVRKVVLMSATLSQHDLDAMGLGGKRVLWLNCPSPIPPSRRRVLYQPAGNMSFASQDRDLPKIAAKILQLASQNEAKGLVHVPYSLAMKLRPLLASNSRFIFHGRQDKSLVYDAWCDSSPEAGKVLVGSGMSEGLDLAYDAAGWQVIAKVPYLSLADPAIRWLAENKPEVYAWQTIRAIMQACGRVCRAPDDWGLTYILDSSFERLYTNHKDLFSPWWCEAFN